MKTFRDNGAIGALLDEYERAVIDLQKAIKGITSEELITIVDIETKDTDCKSIQTILTHVVRAGYGYVIVIRKWLGEEVNYMDRKKLQTIEEYQEALDLMFQYNEKLFEDHPQLPLEAYEATKKFKTSWGQIYDVEQLFEHAIVHILRHRRQIERFLIRLR